MALIYTDRSKMDYGVDMKLFSKQINLLLPREIIDKVCEII